MEPEGNKEEKMLNYEIGIALGFPIHELDEMMKKDNEVLEFRRNILNVTKAAVEERDKEGKRSQALYAFPPEIETNPLPRSLEDKLDKEDKFIISIWQLSPSCEKQKYTVKSHNNINYILNYLTSRWLSTTRTRRFTSSDTPSTNPSDTPTRSRVNLTK